MQRRFASNLEEVDALCRELRVVLRDAYLAPVAFAVELVAREALNNAVLHGNARQANKRVEFELACGRKWIRVTVSDQGPGFPWRSRCRDLPPVTSGHGRGLRILSQYARRVQFSRQGNRVTLWLDRERPTRAAPRRTSRPPRPTSPGPHLYL